jgi:hypothetical protein
MKAFTIEIFSGTRRKSEVNGGMNDLRFAA